MKHGSHQTYIAGFVISVILTLAAYGLVTAHVLSGGGLVAAIISLALAQLVVQLVLFLHLGQESKPRWNVLAFGFMTVVVGILVFGSLWIMNNLDYHMMSPTNIEQSIIEDEGISQ